MDHNLRRLNPLGNSIPHTISRRSPQSREVSKVLVQSSGRLDINIDVALRPEHAVTDLVAQAHEGEVDAGFGEGLHGA